MCSLSPDVNDPAFRNVTFDELVGTTYSEATRALLRGGADLLLIETIFDTLNAKAAIYAVQWVFEEMGVEAPMITSGTTTDAPGPTPLRPDDRKRSGTRCVTRSRWRWA